MHLVDQLATTFSKNLRWALALAMFASVFGVYGCGGTQGQDGDGDVEGNIVIVTGVVSSRGGTPFSLLLLETRDGNMYVLEPSHLAEELRNLDGMEVRIRGSIVPMPEEQHDGLNVISYELLALPSGETPIVGVIRSGALIEDENLVTWIMKGEFHDVLSSFIGAKVWIVGVPMEWIDRPEGRYRVIQVTEYGVIRP